MSVVLVDYQKWKYNASCSVMRSWWEILKLLLWPEMEVQENGDDRPKHFSQPAL